MCEKRRAMHQAWLVRRGWCCTQPTNFSCQCPQSYSLFHEFSCLVELVRKKSNQRLLHLFLSFFSVAHFLSFSMTVCIGWEEIRSSFPPNISTCFSFSLLAICKQGCNPLHGSCLLFKITVYFLSRNVTHWWSFGLFAFIHFFRKHITKPLIFDHCQIGH